MKTSELDREIRSRIESFLGDLSALVKRSALASITSVLGQADATAGAVAAGVRRGPGRPRKSGVPSPLVAPTKKPGAKRGRRPSAQVEQAGAMMLELVKAKPGLRLEEIARELKASTKVLKLPALKMVKARVLRTEGQKRGTKYFAGGKGKGRGK